jgi:hypothetical protein
MVGVDILKGHCEEKIASSELNKLEFIERLQRNVLFTFTLSERIIAESAYAEVCQIVLTAIKDNVNLDYVINMLRQDLELSSINLNKSTSTIGNLVEDHRRAAIAKFLNKLNFI